MDATKMRLGICNLTFNGVDLGLSKGELVVEYGREFADITADQFGSTPYDKILTGNMLKVTAPLAEYSINILRRVIGEADLQEGGSGTRLGLGRDAGFSMRSVAAELVIHPRENTSADTTEDITIYKAVSTEPISLNFSLDDQTVFEVTFEALYDDRFANGRRLGHIGPVNIS